jgi:microcin C transport system substrate-binding protein
VNRRFVLKTALLGLTAQRLPFSAWTSAAAAQDAAAARNWRHGLSLFGDLKYPPGFTQFDYVNANAPKGGAARHL